MAKTHFVAMVNVHVPLNIQKEIHIQTVVNLNVFITMIAIVKNPAYEINALTFVLIMLVVVRLFVKRAIILPPVHAHKECKEMHLLNVDHIKNVC